jgi:hypothetical protein
MPEPLTLETIESEFSEDTEAWANRDQESGNYVVGSDHNYPGKKIIHFFLKQEDAEAYAQILREGGAEGLKGHTIITVKEKLKPALRGIGFAGHPYTAAVHPPNEMYEYFKDVP